jgi:hypothetical protein
MPRDSRFDKWKQGTHPATVSLPRGSIFLAQLPSCAFSTLGAKLEGFMLPKIRGRSQGDCV